MPVFFAGGKAEAYKLPALSKKPRRMSQEAANLACSSSVSFSSRISSIPFLPMTQGTPAATFFWPYSPLSAVEQGQMSF